MRLRRAFGFLVIVTAAMTAAHGGHELPIYPSFYPHEIEIRTIAPETAAVSLAAGKLQAYVGPGLSFRGSLPKDVEGVETLGSYIVLRANPESSRVKDRPCEALDAVARDLAERADGFMLHPYPVTPFHGDYLYHADLAEAAKRRVSGGALSAGDLAIKAGAEFTTYYPSTDQSFDVEIIAVDVAELISTHMLEVNGLTGPPWLKQGWWHASLMLDGAISDADRKQEIERDRRRLMTDDVAGAVERLNVERNLVRALTSGCRALIAGYTLKREYLNIEFSAGIENIGYDSLLGLASPMFIRTVKLKDFPWNGWLMLGMQAQPKSAFNPIGGMTDPFGRLLRFAVGDPALLPAPYDVGWMLNRIADLPASAKP
jgi:hypothetical protein